MKKKQLEMIQYMLLHKRTTSSQLAKHLDISTRSIKTYIAQINQEIPELITSDHTGYRIARDKAKICLKQEDTIPQTHEERSLFIIKKFLLDHVEALDIYDLCDALFIGYSTLKAEIQNMNKAYVNFGLHFITQKDQLQLSGSEKDKRKLLSYIISEEANENFMDIKQLKDCFSNLDIDKLAEIILHLFQSYHYYLNDFSYMNLLMHISILLDRVLEGNVLSQQKNIEVNDPSEAQLLQELCMNLENEFNVILNEQERFEIYILIKTNANYAVHNNMLDLVKIVGQDLIDMTRTLIKQISDVYFIDLQDQNFLIPFAIHMKGLFFRLQNSTYVKNPMAKTIRENCPLIYDMAVLISIRIQHMFHKAIKEDEIAYLALHLGSEIERQQINDTKIRCSLLCPSYQGMQTRLYNQLLKDFGHLIYIVTSCVNEAKINEKECDLLISTMPLYNHYDCEILEVAPFKMKEQQGDIANIIYRIMNDKKKAMLKSELDHYVNNKLFFTDLCVEDKYEAITYLVRKMEVGGYVDETFLSSVILREQASSTGFGQIAIPHSIDVPALKSGIGIVLSEEGIMWDHEKVHIIFLLAIHSYDQRVFSLVYEALIKIFEDKEVMRELIKCKDFLTFEEMLLHYS